MQHIFNFFTSNDFTRSFSLISTYNECFCFRMDFLRPLVPQYCISCALSILWESNSFYDIPLCVGASFMTQIATHEILKVGEKILLTPRTTKTGAKDGPMHIFVGSDPHCATNWLQRLTNASVQCGNPITGYITRPSDPSGKHTLFSCYEIFFHQYLCTISIELT